MNPIQALYKSHSCTKIALYLWVACLEGAWAYGVPGLQVQGCWGSAFGAQSLRIWDYRLIRSIDIGHRGLGFAFYGIIARVTLVCLNYELYTIWGAWGLLGGSWLLRGFYKSSIGFRIWGLGVILVTSRKNKMFFPGQGKQEGTDRFPPK